MSIQVEKDIKAAMNILDRKGVSKEEYRRVKIFPNRSLKTLKKYNVKDKQVLTKFNSTAEILDLVSYNANVTCYSTNRLDEYFLNLNLALVNLSYKDYINYILKNNPKFTKKCYERIRTSLDEETRYFFDEIYKYIALGNIFKTNLCDLSKYDYETLLKNIRYLINSRYNQVKTSLQNHQIEFLLAKDSNISMQFQDETFNFINLSYNIDSMDDDKIKYVIEKIQCDFMPLLKEHGKLQGFVSKEGKIIEEFTRIETRSIDDANSNKEECKKDYAYMLKVQ